MMKPLLVITSLLVLVFSLQGCVSKEEKRDQFLQQGIRLYEAGQYKKAILEFKNALQLDQDCAHAYLYMGRTYFKLGNVKRARGNLARAVALNEALDDARLDLGMILVVTKEGERALKTIRPILDKEPTHAKALLIGAQAYLVLKNPDRAIENLDKIDPAKRKKEALFAFAGAHKLKGDTEKVKQYLSEYQKAAPGNPASYLTLSKIYAKEGHLTKAEAEIRKLIKQKRGDPPYYLLLCKFFLDSGQGEKAETELKQLVSENPKKNIYKLAYAEFLFNKKRFDESETLMAKAVRNDPSSWKLRDYLVRVYLFRGKVDSALRELEDFVSSNVEKGKVEALIKKGQILARLGRWEEAEYKCDLALALEMMNPHAHLLKGKALLQKGNFDDAIIHLRQVVDIKPSEPEGYLFLAKAVALSGDISLSIGELKRGLKNVPQNSALFMELIRYYQREHEWEYALEAANAGMAQHPQELAYEIQKGRMLVRLKKLDKAEKVFTSIIERYPSIMAGYVELGRLKKTTGKYGEATALFEKALVDTKQKNAVALTLLLETYMETKQETRAEALCRQMLKDNPENALLLSTLGTIYLQQGKYQEAEYHFKASIKASPRWRRPHCGLVAVYTQTERLQEASHDLGKKYTQNPGSLGIGFTLSLLYEELGQYDKAIALWEELVTKYPDIVTINNNLAYLYAEHYPDPERLNKA
ncbi:MAG: tetratricopeptide repeat protein, partial [Deltaproteobacteria bacterium]|nr:tetratricopeptide repeat protein [Deltaproteobacteria bacterium]